MATYTSYLNLKKPEGGERYSLADFNANMQKIDDFAGKHGITTLSTVANVTALGNSLLAFGQTMGAERRYIEITFSAQSGVFVATKYIGEIRRLFSDVERYRVTLYQNVSNVVIDGSYNGSVWTWEKLALDSKKGDYSETPCTLHIYDYETKIGEVSCICFRIGKICIVPIYFTNFNYSFSTMLQFRNLPFHTCIGGSIYISTMGNGQGADRTIQQSSVGAYFRPNVTGSFSGGVASFMLIGIDVVF